MTPQTIRWLVVTTTVSGAPRVYIPINKITAIGERVGPTHKGAFVQTEDDNFPVEEDIDELFAQIGNGGLEACNLSRHFRPESMPS